MAVPAEGPHVLAGPFDDPLGSSTPAARARPLAQRARASARWEPVGRPRVVRPRVGLASIPSMATTSYLQELAGGMVAAAAFDDDDAAVSAVTLLRESGMQEQDISVIARDRRRAELIAGDRAWLPGKGWSGLMARMQRLLNGGVPKDVTTRYKKALRSGQVVLVAAAGDQPPDTIAALMRQARGDLDDMWWQGPTLLFAPPELAGPF